jgi:hypothetical protein
VIVYNERGHRIDDDDIDVYPEDDVSSQNNNSKSNANGRSSSRSHTPIDSYHPPSSSNSRRASNAAIPDVTRIDTRTIEVSKGYTPSIAPSARSATYRSSDGERLGSDSERRKGKERHIQDETDRDRGMPGGLSPIERTASTGLASSPIAKVGSIHSAIGGEMLSSNMNPPASASRPPSIKPQSRTQSIYGGDGDHNPAQDLQHPQSVIDEQNNLAPPISPRSAALNAILDRPMSSFGDRSRSHTPFGGSRPRTPITHEPPVSARIGNTPGITRSNTPFIDRPKSGIEGSFFDRPRSAFGNGSIYGDSGPAMFGDSGPAANIGTGVGTSLFGDPPASVFGDAHAGENDNWGATGREEAGDGWGAGEEVNDNWNGGAGHEGADTYGATTGGGVDESGSTPVDTTAAAEEPGVTTPTAKKEKKQRKNSNAISAPASGVASRASPALSTKKSPFENTADTGFFDDPAAGTRSISPAIQGGGLWGSKAPSPKPLSPLNPASQLNNDLSATGQELNGEFTTTGAAGSEAPSQPLSPLNPASQIHNDPSATDQKEFDWSFGATGGADAATGGETAIDGNDVNLGDNHTKPPTRVPSPMPPTPAEEPAAVEKEPVATGKGKKKKKGSGANTPAKSPHAITREKEEEERVRVEKAEQEKLAAEVERLAKEEAARLQEEQEASERAERERLAAEAEKSAAKAAAAKLEEEQAEKERLVAEAEKLAAEAAAAAKLQEEQAEKERLAAEAEKLAAEAAAAAKLQEEQAEKERLAAEAEKLAAEAAATAKLREEQAEKERLAAEAEKLAAEAAAAAKLQEEQAEKERLAAEAEKLAAEAAAAKLQKEKEEREQAEHERLEQERKAQEKAEQEQLETERLAQEEKDNANAGAAPISAFGSDPPALFSGGLFSSSLNPPDKPWMSDTGGGDDSWNASSTWGTNTKKKKPKAGAKSSGLSSPWGADVFGETPPTATTSPAEELSSSQDAAGLFSFSSTTPNLSLGFDNPKPELGATSPVPTPVDESTPTPVEIEAKPIDLVSPTTENDPVGEEETLGVTVTSKKKKKKGKAETVKEEPALETVGLEDELAVDTPVAETPVEATPAPAGNKKKKKGKK